MRYMILMNILDRVDDLFEVEFSLIFVNGRILNVLVEFSLQCKFHDHENIVCSI